VLWEGETAKRYRRAQLHLLRHEKLIFREMFSDIGARRAPQSVTRHHR
jgi:hypothetical protein